MLKGKERETDVRPDAEENIKFWGDIWDRNVRHNMLAEWLKRVKKLFSNVEKQRDLEITRNKVRKQIKKIPKLKASGPDGVHGYWIKSFKNLLGQTTEHCAQFVNGGEVPDWRTKGRICLILKDKAKGKTVTNFRSISCLPIM